jgi:hypothetical protein
MAITTPYSSTANITDSVISAFVSASDSRLSLWRTECDNEIKSLCEQRGVEITTFEALDTVDSKIQEYWRATFARIVCRDNIGVNNVDVAQDEKYRVKYDIYRDECDRLRRQVTPEMFKGDVSDSDPLGAGRIGGGVLWRS